MNSIRVTGLAAALLLGIAGSALLGPVVVWAAEPNVASYEANRARLEQKMEATRAQLEQKLEDAQRRLDKAAREVAELSMSLSDDALPRNMSARRPQRAMLGVGIGEDDEGRDDGVEIQSVSPGGPAADAGLKNGDLLVALNNKSLKRDEDGSARSKLLAVMRGVKPGDKVTARYLRDGKSKTVDLIAKPMSDGMFDLGPLLGRARRLEIPNIAIRRAEGVLGSAELVALTPKLGQYFGTEKGLLVVRAPSDTELEIQEGDVILEIDGRTPTSPAHALRILSSYQPGESLTLNVMRKKRRTSIEFTIPENAPRARIERFERHQNVPARPYSAPRARIAPRSPAVTPAHVWPPAPPAAAVPAPAPEPPQAPVILALPDQQIEIEVEDVF
jgi:type II secretory pathway component PulC